MALTEEIAKIKKILIYEKKPLFLDTNIYKYYCEYKTLDTHQLIKKYQEKSKHILDLKNSEKIFNFIIKHQIVVKKNKILEQEISKVILKSKNLKEKNYYLELIKKLNFDVNVTSYTLEEKNLAKQIAPRTEKKYMEQDFIIIICCDKDNTEIIVTKDREDLKKCIKIYSVHKGKELTFNLISLEKFIFMIDILEKENK